MKIKSITLIISLFTIVQSFAIKVDGTAFLEGTNDHSGIKTVFKAISPSANSDSAFTNTNGEYSLSLSSGVYKVSISKEGYNSIHEGQMLLSVDTVFVHDSLEYFGIRSYLGSTVAGTLYKDTSYVILAKTWLREEDTLYIEPGTHINFAEGASFDVNGILIAQGTIEEKIYFGLMSEESGFWHSINIYAPAKDLIFNYCHFENGSRPLKIYSANHFEIQNCFFENSEWCSVRVDGENTVKSGHIHHNDFSGSHVNAYYGYCDSSTVIEHNIIRNFGGPALNVDTNTIIRYNKIFRNNQAVSGSPKEMHHNDIYYNLTGLGTSTSSDSKIYNNTFFQNGTALSIWDSNTSGEITMNCFSNNGVALKFVKENTQVSINYNFFENDADIIGPGALGYGVGIDTNLNGDATDTYLNVIGNEAGFFSSDTANRHAFFPVASSILIDAGNPIFKDDDGSIRDIGAHPYITWVGINNNENIPVSLRVYPNPFSDFVVFDFEHSFNDVFSLHIYDVSGNLVVKKTGLSGPRYHLTNHQLDQGIYFYKINNSQMNYQGKLMIE